MQNELRFLSQLPSATETVCALGLGPYLVGRSHECDYPERVTGIAGLRPAVQPETRKQHRNQPFSESNP